jgi:hypothetical protein
MLALPDGGIGISRFEAHALKVKALKISRIIESNSLFFIGSSSSEKYSRGVRRTACPFVPE